MSEAKQIVRAASKEHTLYRAIISVGKEVAETHGLYHREEWEKLIERHIQTIPKEMQIKPENFCWYASFHCEKGHPHVHILYWDNGADPRPDFVPKPLFEARTERIRAAFAGDLNKEQILEAQKAQREELKQLRTTLQAMCLEANPEKAINMRKLYSSQSLNGLSQQFAELIRNIPAKGSLRYAYLPADYKVLVDSFITQSLQQPELAKELTQYERLTRKISELYANSETAAAGKLEQAMKKLYTALGNEVMAAVREAKDEILMSSPTDDPALRSLLHEAVAELATSTQSYQELLALLPRERIPVGSMYQQIPNFGELMNTILGELMSDARLRLRLENYALDRAGIDLDQKPDAPKRTSAPEDTGESSGSESEDKSDGHRFRGKLLSDEEWSSYLEARKELELELRREILQQLRDDAGWSEEAARTNTVSVFSGFMSLLSQMVSQQRARTIPFHKALSKDMSKEARKDRWAQQQQASEIFDDF